MKYFALEMHDIYLVPRLKAFYFNNLYLSEINHVLQVTCGMNPGMRAREEEAGYPGT